MFLATNEGAVGIGFNYAPAHKLDVVGDINTSDFYRVGGVKLGATATNWNILYGKNESERIRLGGSNNTNEYDAFTHTIKDGSTKYAEFTYGASTLRASDNQAAFTESGMVFQNNAGALQPFSSAAKKVHVFNVLSNVWAKSAIDSIGRWGIGTITPLEKVHISGGNLRIDDTYALRFGGVGFNTYQPTMQQTSYGLVAMVGKIRCYEMAY